MQPEEQVERADVRPHIAKLLLSRAHGLLSNRDSSPVLCNTVRNHFQDLSDAGIRICAEPRKPTVLFANKNHPHQAAHWWICRQECFVGLHRRFVVQVKLLDLPATPSTGALGETDPLGSVLPRSAAALLHSRLRDRPQRRVFSQSSHHDRTGSQCADEGMVVSHTRRRSRSRPEHLQPAQGSNWPTPPVPLRVRAWSGTSSDTEPTTAKHPWLARTIQPPAAASRWFPTTGGVRSKRG